MVPCWWEILSGKESPQRISAGFVHEAGVNLTLVELGPKRDAKRETTSSGVFLALPCKVNGPSGPAGFCKFGSCLASGSRKVKRSQKLIPFLYATAG